MAANPIPMPDDDALSAPLLLPEPEPVRPALADPQMSLRREHLYVVFWRYESGEQGCGSSQPRMAAELMMLAYSARYKDRRYWIEPSRDGED